MASAEAPGEQSAIYKQTLECRQLFTECEGISELDGQDWLDDRQADFNWWAYGINADKIGRSSLDYRVRDHPDIKRVFLGLLEGIALALTESQRIAQESHSIISAASSPTVSPIGGKDGRFSPWSDLPDSDSDAEGSDRAHPLPSSLSEQKFYVQHSLSLLSRLTIAIKRAGAKFRYQRADETPLTTSHQYNGLRRHLASMILLGPFITQIWAHILRAGLPTSVAIVIQAWISDTARLSPVQRRVVEAVVLRRNRIVHADKKWKGVSEEVEERHKITKPKRSEHQNPEAHDFKLTKSLPTRDTSVTGIPTELATAIPSDFGLPSAAARRTGTSMYTEITRRGMQQDYPGCPVSEGNFTCPFCSCNLPAAYAESKERWRGHVAQDICPYICVFEDCQTPNQLYITSDEWRTHMRKCHRVIRWVCSDCSVRAVSEADYTFDTASEWERHIRTHGDLTSGSRLPVLSKLSERSSIPPVSCPLCSRPEGPLPLDEDDHIAGHLHSFALKSLPWVEIGDDLQTIDNRASVLSRDYLAGTDLDNDGDVGERVINSTLEKDMELLVVDCVGLLENDTSNEGNQLVGSLKWAVNSMKSMSEAEKEMFFSYATRLRNRLLEYSGNLTQDLLRESLDDLGPVVEVALLNIHSEVLITPNDEFGEQDWSAVRENKQGLSDEKGKADPILEHFWTRRSRTGDDYEDIRVLGGKVQKGVTHNYHDGPLSRLVYSKNAPFNSKYRHYAQICHENTRTDLLRDIYNWVDGKDERYIFWLKGLAGTGKSTIAQRVAKHYYDQKRLAASFFFTRDGGDASHAGLFATSVAVQLANNVPLLRDAVCMAITEFRDITTRSLSDQWRHLVLQPFSSLEVRLSPSTYLIVIDALDECNSENDIQTILQLLSEARPLRLRFLLTSRPNTAIRRGFDVVPTAERRDNVLYDPGQLLRYDSPLYGPLTIMLPHFPGESDYRDGDVAAGLGADDNNQGNGISKVDEGRKLLAHFLWSAAKVVAQGVEDADAIEKKLGSSHADKTMWSVKGHRVLELGAGAGLPSIISVLASASHVTITDHPSSPAFLGAFEHNITENVPASLRPNIDSTPHAWGVLENDQFAQKNKGGFTRIIAADCLWMLYQHENLARTLLWFLSDGKGNGIKEEGRAWVVAGFHTGRAIVANFFETAVAMGLEIESIYERDLNVGEEEEAKAEQGEVRRAWEPVRAGERPENRRRWCVIAVLKRAKSS